MSRRRTFRDAVFPGARLGEKMPVHLGRSKELHELRGAVEERQTRFKRQQRREHATLCVNEAQAEKAVPRFQSRQTRRRWQSGRAVTCGRAQGFRSGKEATLELFFPKVLSLGCTNFTPRAARYSTERIYRHVYAARGIHRAQRRVTNNTNRLCGIRTVNSAPFLGGSFKNAQ